jgi:hypothetical protein
LNPNSTPDLGDGIPLLPFPPHPAAEAEIAPARTITAITRKVLPSIDVSGAANQRLYSPAL